MKQLYHASKTPHYIFKYPNQSFIGDVTFTYQKNFFNKKELDIVDKLAKTLDFMDARVGNNNLKIHGDSQRLEYTIQFNTQYIQQKIKNNFTILTEILVH